MRIKFVGAEDEPDEIKVEGDAWNVGDIREVEDDKAKRILHHAAFSEVDEEVTEATKKSKKEKVIQ